MLIVQTFDCNSYVLYVFISVELEFSVKNNISAILEQMQRIEGF